MSEPQQNMQAIEIREPGSADVLRLVTMPRPVPGDRDVLVRVEAAGVNRPDILQRQGRYPVPGDASPLPGLEIAGEIVSAGAGVTRWRIGDRVMALTHGGGYAEYCRVFERHCLPIPAALSAVEAAAVPETFFTVWYNVFMRCRLERGETLLVHGGSSGIGTTAIQLARAAGCRVITTAGTAEKCRFCEALGADRAVNYRDGDWTEAVRDFSGGRGVDVALDMVAGAYVQKNLDCLAKEGRLAIIAFLGGPESELDLRVLLAKRLTITGSTLRPQTNDEKARIADALSQHVLPLLADGTVRPVIHATFPLAEAAAAHELMESGGHMGKIVLKVAAAG